MRDSLCVAKSSAAWTAPDSRPLGEEEIQASHRKYQCLGRFGFAGATGFSSGLITEMLSIFTTRL